MTKTLTTFAFIILFALPSIGQITFGTKAGLNISNTKIENFTHAAKVGFNIGMLTQIKINRKFMLQPELIYSTKGSIIPTEGMSSKEKISLNYINIPILFGYYPTEKLLIHAGPEIGFLTTAKVKYDNNIVNLKQVYQKIDVGIDIGTAYNLNKNVGLDIRYIAGFKDLIKGTFENGSGTGIEEKTIGSNRVLQIGIYYLFKK
jgi:hypothetical protein